jgi:hypothetical protein
LPRSTRPVGVAAVSAPGAYSGSNRTPSSPSTTSTIERTRRRTPSSASTAATVTTRSVSPNADSGTPRSTTTRSRTASGPSPWIVPSTAPSPAPTRIASYSTLASSPRTSPTTIAPSPSRSAVRSAVVGSIPGPSSRATRSVCTSRPLDWAASTGNSGVSSTTTVRVVGGISQSSPPSSVVLPAPRPPATSPAAPRSTATDSSAAAPGESVSFPTSAGSVHVARPWPRKAKAVPSLTGVVTPAARTRRPPRSAVASSVGLARENARPLSRRSREASVRAPAGVRRTFVATATPSTTTRSGVRRTGAVAYTSETRSSAKRSSSTP